MSHLFAANKRNAEFHELFKNIPQDELLIDSYSCALSREILIHGRLYLSANYACFNANILGWVTNIVVYLKDIVSIEKKMTALIIPNGITLSTLHTRHVYASFLKRDEAYNKICRVWKNCIADKPIPTTELLAQIASGKANIEYQDEILNQKRFRDRKTSLITDNGIESIMSDDCSLNGDPDPALTVRREYNFGTSRTKMISSKSFDLVEEQSSDVIDGDDHNNEESIKIETEEEQKEVRESILPCACTFHYKNTLMDQLVLVPLPQMTEGLLFSPKTSLTSVPKAFQRTLKELGAREVKFSPWKVYLGKWERRVWSCELPARKLLLQDAYLTIKVTDSIISRQNNKICVESLMQIDGIPGGGSFVKWKLCGTSPNSDSPVSEEQCRITITAAAASPLGSWFKDTIRSALLQHARELWSKAIENAALLDYSDDSNSLDSRSGSFSKAYVKSSESISKLIFPQNLHHSLSSVTLTYFDRKAFFLSISRIVMSILVLVMAIFIGNRIVLRPANQEQKVDLQENQSVKFQKYSEMIQNDYYEFVENNLKLQQSYPEILNQAANEFNMLDEQLTEIVGQVYRIQREIADQRIN